MTSLIFGQARQLCEREPAHHSVVAAHFDDPLALRRGVLHLEGTKQVYVATVTE